MKHKDMTGNIAHLIDAETVGQIIGKVGTEGFGPALDAALQCLVPFDLTAIMAYPAGQRPALLHDGLNNVSDPGAMQAYLTGTYLLDAFYTACKNEIAEGLYRLSDVAPDAFFEGEYYNSPLVHPCISLSSGALAEEIAFVVRLQNGVYVTYSLMRSNGGRAFGADELARLAPYVPIVRAAVQRNWAAWVPPGQRAAQADPTKAAFRSFAADVLSPREQDIVGLVLLGHSSASVGLNLGIAEGTVKNHRKHIHAKLGISSQAELFALFLRHLRNG
ncbi:MAG: response regulator transcription factor [Paracoccaceae bacterium]